MAENLNRDFIAKIDINKHPEFKTLDCRYEGCNFVRENFDKLVVHIHKVHVSQEILNPPANGARVYRLILLNSVKMLYLANIFHT